MWDTLSSSVYSHLKISLVLFEHKEALQFQQEDVLNNSMVTQEENVQLLQDGANHLQYSCKGGVFPALDGNAWD